MAKFADILNLTPIKLTMQDLRCDVYVLFAGKRLNIQNICKQLQKLGFNGDNIQLANFKKCALECKDNPGYTVQVSSLDCIVVIKPSSFANQSVTELIGTLVHEFSHAVTMLLDDVGCQNDDELRSIELENILVQAMQSLKIDQLLA